MSDSIDVGLSLRTIISNMSPSDAEAATLAVNTLKITVLSNLYISFHLILTTKTLRGQIEQIMDYMHFTVEKSRILRD